MRSKTWLGLVVGAQLAIGACGERTQRSDQLPSTQGGTGAAGTPSGVTSSPGDLPCDVAAILSQHCADCHGAMPRLGAPIALIDAAAFQAERQGQTVGALVADRIQNASKPMPPFPLPALDAAQIAVLTNWVNAGAAPANPGCAVTAPAAPAPQAGSTAPPQAAGTGGGAPPAGEVDAGTGAPGEAAGEWTTYGRDLANTRSNPDERALSPATVPGLRRIWEFSGPSTTSTPAIAGDVVFLPGWDGKVYALRAEDGGEVWTAQLPDLIDSSPAVTETRVYVSDDAGSVHALDRTTGAIAWSRVVDPHPEAHLWSSPVVIPDAGLVVVGVASSEEAVRATEQAPYSFRGSVVALDAQSGEPRWQFYTTDNDAQSGPGVAVWASAAVDTARKLLYIGTGNNYAEPAGPYSDALLAIDYEEGTLAWATQFTAGDVFTIYGAGQGPDYDIGASANLFTAGGRELVGVGVKSGLYYALDRDAGAIAWMAPITPGGPLGGVMSAPAFADGLIFAASNDQLAGKTSVVALRADDGGIVWRYDTPMSTYGGLAHANGVLYVGTTAGTILALDAATGAMLWSDQLPDSIAGSPVVAGGTLFVPWGYQWTLREGMPGTGGLVAYGL